LERRSSSPEAGGPWRRVSTQTIFLHQAIADHFGLNITDHKCLGLLMGQGNMTAGMLAEASGLTTGAITGVVDRLERRGFVKRVPSETDRRQTTIVVQRDALDGMFVLFEDLAARTERIMSNYSDAECRAILDFFARSGDMIEEFVASLREKA